MSLCDEPHPTFIYGSCEKPLGHDPIGGHSSAFDGVLIVWDGRFYAGG